jgi:hypothetical protein
VTILPRILPQNEADLRAKILRQILRKEAEMGGKLFGSVPEGRHRQFFCLDRHTWIWHEEWKNAQGKRQSVTTRYEVRPDGVIKIQDGHVYQNLSPEEFRNFKNAVHMYRDRLRTKKLQAA